MARLMGHPPPSSPSNPDVKLLVWLLGAQIPLEGLKKLLQNGYFRLQEYKYLSMGLKNELVDAVDCFETGGAKNVSSL